MTVEQQMVLLHHELQGRGQQEACFLLLAFIHTLIQQRVNQLQFDDPDKLKLYKERYSLDAKTSNFTDFFFYKY